MQIIQSADAVISALGGVHRVATIFGVVPGAVYNWRRDGVLPARTFPLCMEELSKRGMFAPPKLWTVHQDTKRKPRRRNGR